MTGRIPSDGYDEALEKSLREAFARAEPPAAPEAVRSRATELAGRPESGGWPGGVRPGTPSFGFAALAVVLAIGLVGALVTTGPHSTTQGQDDLSPDPSPNASPCSVSVPVRRDDGSLEIGGPRAFFQVFSGSYLSGAYPWKLPVRIVPDLRDAERVAVTAVHLDSGDREDADYNGTFGIPDPPVEGGMHLFIQPFPVPGCWQLSAEIDGEIVGSATIDVPSGAGSLRAGTYATQGSIDGVTCLGFAIEQSRFGDATDVPAWLWPATPDGACGERPDDPVHVTAVIRPLEPWTERQPHPGHELQVELAREDGASRTATIVLYSSECCLSGVVSSAANRPVFFDQVRPLE